MRSVARSSHAGQETGLGDVALGQAGEVDGPFPDRTLRGSITSLERYDDVESIIVTFIVTAFAWEAVETARAHWRNVADQLDSKMPKRAMIMDEAEHDVLAKLLMGQILNVLATLLFGVWAAT